MDREELKRLTKEEISRRIREGVKAVIEQVLEEEMTEHLAAGYKGAPSRRGERNGYSTGTSSRRRAGSPSSGYPGTGRGPS
jgi:transposase-like protein